MAETRVRGASYRLLDHEHVSGDARVSIQISSTRLLRSSNLKPLVIFVNTQLRS